MKYTRYDSDAGDYYYGAFRVTVSTTGNYRFTSISSIDTFGYLYNASFISSSPSMNLLSFNDDSGGNGQFRIVASLQTNVVYVLVATTFDPSTTGSYTVIASGPSTVTFVQVNTVSTLPSTTSSSLRSSTTTTGKRF